MHEFKIDDWVTHKNFGLGKVELQTYPNPTLNELVVHTDNNSYRKFDGWELWQPKEGEWCWFWDDGEHPQVDRFWWRKDNSKGLNPKQFVGHITYKAYEYCEPFIGELPSFLQK